MLTDLISQASDALASAGAFLAQAPPSPGPGSPPADSPGIDTTGIIKFFAMWIAPIPIAILGVIFLFRSPQGQVSRVVTSSWIAIAGIIFLASALVLPMFGGTLVDLIFTGE
jgi:hypothetical protein